MPKNHLVPYKLRPKSPLVSVHPRSVRWITCDGSRKQTLYSGFRFWTCKTPPVMTDRRNEWCPSVSEPHARGMLLSFAMYDLLRCFLTKNVLPSRGGLSRVLHYSQGSCRVEPTEEAGTVMSKSLTMKVASKKIPAILPSQEFGKFHCAESLAFRWLSRETRFRGANVSEYLRAWTRATPPRLLLYSDATTYWENPEEAPSRMHHKSTGVHYGVLDFLAPFMDMSTFPKPSKLCSIEHHGSKKVLVPELSFPTRDLR